MCGVGDQAVDPDSALDNAELDIKEGVRLLSRVAW